MIGGFSDDFQHFKDTTGYDSFTDESGKEWGSNIGFSKRWRNSNIRSPNIVAGFQFKIGPSSGERWKIKLPNPQKIILGRYRGGDVNLFFPRKLTEGNDWFGDLVFRKRGGYFVQIKWDADLKGYGYLGKEIPHGTYGKHNYFLLGEDGKDHYFRSHPNPGIRFANPRDGQWHSLLAVIFNDWYRNKSVNFAQSGLYPTIGLWYSHIPTFKYEDFEFVGMGIDNQNMPPGPPIKFGIRDSNATIGDTPLPEHALQIRIDDVPTEQVFIRNFYAANVIYHGPIPPQNPPTECVAQAKAVSDAQVKLQKLLDREKEARENFQKHIHDVGGGLSTDNPWLQIINNLIDVEIPNALSDLGTAKFMYGECANIGFFRKRPFDSLRRWLQITGSDASQGIRSIMSSFSVSSIRQLIGSP